MRTLLSFPLRVLLGRKGEGAHLGVLRILRQYATSGRVIRHGWIVVRVGQVSAALRRQAQRQPT